MAEMNIEVCGSVSSVKYGEDLVAVWVRHVADLERRFHSFVAPI